MDSQTAASLKRRDVGGVLLLLDGDVTKIGSVDFCAAEIAHLLASEAAIVGAGARFSTAIVFARQEYETWFVAGIESLAGRQLPDGRVIDANVQAPGGDLEESPRNAKGWLGRVIQGGYKPTRDQAALSDMVDLQVVRSRRLRSFQRLESAVSELVSAIRNDSHVATPSQDRKTAAK